jgi:hypothetical protein
MSKYIKREANWGYRYKPKMKVSTKIAIAFFALATSYFLVHVIVWAVKGFQVKGAI